MKLAQFKTKHSARPGVGLWLNDGLIDIAALARAVADAGGDLADWLLNVTDMRDVITRGSEGLSQIDALLHEAQARGVSPQTLALDSIQFLPAVNPSKILAIGRNYVDHAIEGGGAPPEAPLIFNKLPNSLSAHNAPIVLPGISQKVDYEAELAVVIGRPAKRVSEPDAFKYVFGYTLINDVS